MKTTRNVPALRYDLFIKAFEKEVTAAQSRIKAIEAMEQPYNLVKEALEAAKLPNDTTLSLSPSVVKIVMQDRKSTRLNSSHIQKSRMPSSA